MKNIMELCDACGRRLLLFIVTTNHKAFETKAGRFETDRLVPAVRKCANVNSED